MSINKVIITGRFTADPEPKQTPSGKLVTNFTLAQNRGKDEASFFNFTAWDKTAEFICKYFSKGDGIEVDGHLSVRAYEKDGAKRTAYEVIADHVDFPVNKKSDGGQAVASAPAPQYTGETAPSFEEIKDDEDLPF